jgi:hypothetical protein
MLANTGSSARLNPEEEVVDEMVNAVLIAASRCSESAQRANVYYQLLITVTFRCKTLKC